MNGYLRTSESVTEGHPDVICNKIANEILDEAVRVSLPLGRHPRVAVEVSAKGNKEGGTLLLFGEITLPSGASLDYEKIARKTIAKIGYTNPDFGFWHNLPEVLLRITQQSSDINHGVSQKRTGAGDQGLMIGGAVADEGPEFMPLPIMMAHALTRAYTRIYKAKKLEYLRPDGKSQVVVRYVNGKPKAIEHVILAASHDKKVNIKQVRSDLYHILIAPILDKFGFSINPKKQLVINGGGPWTIFGPYADAGTTNRKIIVDSYGGAFPHGGGGFNGKDWTKVDVSGAVGARFLAKTIVANGLAKKAQVEVSYALGCPDPLGIYIETFGTEKVPLRQLWQKAKKVLDLSVDGIIETLKLARPIYSGAAAGGWFGRKEFPWEQVPSL